MPKLECGHPFQDDVKSKRGTEMNKWFESTTSLEGQCHSKAVVKCGITTDMEPASDPVGSRTSGRRYLDAATR